MRIRNSNKSLIFLFWKISIAIGEKKWKTKTVLRAKLVASFNEFLIHLSILFSLHVFFFFFLSVFQWGSFGSPCYLRRAKTKQRIVNMFFNILFKIYQIRNILSTNKFCHFGCAFGMHSKAYELWSYILSPIVIGKWHALRVLANEIRVQTRLAGVDILKAKNFMAQWTNPHWDVWSLVCKGVFAHV